MGFRIVKLKFSISILLLFAGVILHAQNLKVNVRDYTSKIDSLPFFKYELQELDTFINLCKVMPSAAEVIGIYCKVDFTFKVDRNGTVNSFKSYKVNFDYPKSLVVKDEEKLNELRALMIKDAERTIKSTSALWYSDSVKEKNTIVYSIKYVSEGYDRIDKNVADGDLKVGLKLGSSTNFESKRSLYNFGVKKMSGNRTLLAKNYFEQAVFYFPKDIDAFYNLGVVNYKLKKVSDACSCWNKCLELGDNSVVNELNKYCK